MNPPEVIVRIAAKGDGVSASGRHVPGAVPGDLLHADGSLEFGPHHIAPCCRHFGRCGGCQLQHCDEDTLAGFVTSRVINAASRQGLEPEVLLPAHLSPPRSRRRARLHVARVGRGTALGFRAAGSHQVI
ncbi:MAG: class I SAM-dependent RNA methyltransferase, partial [Novosphingobium sp.]|nr:class I SAM-dependent RNA methyltransferase [Novosphingobium sp.]